MINQTIKALLHQLNNKLYQDSYVSKELSDTVIIAKLWLMKTELHDQLSESSDSPLTFYFIKNQEGRYVGAVLDQLHDLHCYVLPADRKKGYMSQALERTILPHLFQNRYFQRVNLEKVVEYYSTKAAKALVKKFGFVQIEDMNSYVLTHEDFFKNSESTPIVSNLDLVNELDEIPQNKIEELSQQILQASLLLSMVQVEIEFKFGDSEYSKSLLAKKNDIKDMAFRLQNLTSKYSDHAISY